MSASTSRLGSTALLKRGFSSTRLLATPSSSSSSPPTSSLTRPGSSSDVSTTRRSKAKVPKIGKKAFEELDVEYKYKYPDVAPNVQHPSYKEYEIMDFRDSAAKLPPTLATKRSHKLKTAKQLGVPSHRLNKPKRGERLPLPSVPVFTPERPKVEKVEYQVGKVGVTNEQRQYFDDASDSMSAQDTDWTTAEEGEEIPGLDVGRVVEVRRSGQRSIGMILASVTISGKPRILLLRITGEVWPISNKDIQFVMPSSLIQPEVAEACWSPDLVDLWAQGDEASSQEITSAMGPMQEARRQAVMVLRKIHRESERMEGRMIGGIGRDRFGGIEGVWDAWAGEDENSRVSITSAQAAEYILNPKDAETRTVIRPNTLPAYAAHCLLMSRPDLFLADPGQMWSSGRFMVRSRAERARAEQALRLVDGLSVEDKRVLDGFVAKCRAAALRAKEAREADLDTTGIQAVEADLPEWTDEERTILEAILGRLYESRTTQTSPLKALPTRIMKLMDVYDGKVMDIRLIPQLLSDIGVLAPWDSLRASEIAEDEHRAITTAGINLEEIANPEEGLLKGNELDDLRHDFTSQKVFVIDDASASELDDGVSIERIHGSDEVWVHVHVADPTRFIPLSSPAAIRASFRSSSLYLPEANIPLFPLEVIMKDLSLGADVERDGGAQGTITISSRINPSNGEVLDSTVRMGWIKKPVVVTYNAVNEALGVAGSKTVHPLGIPDVEVTRHSKEDTVLSAEDVEDLKLIQRLAQVYRDNRLKEAGLEWYQSQSDLRLRSPVPPTPSNLFDYAQIPSSPQIYTGNPLIEYSFQNPSETYSGLPSTSIVAEMMILAGRAAAQFCNSRNIPIPYRTSQAPVPAVLPGSKPITLEDILAQRDPQSKMSDRYTMAAANLYFSAGEVGLEPGQHWAMGFTDLGGYTRATSPLRRFEDMLVHWQIKSALVKESKSTSIDASVAKEISKEDMENLVKRSQGLSKKTKKAGQVSSLFWEAGLFASRLRNARPDGYIFTEDTVDLSQPIPARIAGPTIFGVSSSQHSTPVYLPTLGATARLPGTGKLKAKIGDEISVKVLQAQQWPAPITDVKLASE